jgi:cellulose synthase/poly-beta-1,6-N-acetylglucosamine synthase-like glycosyltransferase
VIKLRDVPPHEAALRLAQSLDWVEQAMPGLSARAQPRRRQRAVLGASAVAFAVPLLLFTRITLVVMVTLITIVYLVTVVHRVAIFRMALGHDSSCKVSDEEARSLPGHLLPIYTVLVPAYHEPEVIAALVANLSRLEYPPERLDVKLLLERDDQATIEAALNAPSALDIELLLLPEGEPRTKPRALNYGLTFARGDLVTIYDAEDDPEPLQLRRAVAALNQLSPDVACLQARLTFHNPEQNMITRWFTAEYATWFTFYLPGLSGLKAPIPLGGTSNHFKRTALADVGAWDPYNVTEDADLGIRLCRKGWQVGVLDSVTLEEANSDFVNWVKQRSRWYKGYLQTFLAHMRVPRRLQEAIGWQGLFHFVVFVGGTPILAILNPLFWAMTGVWLVSHSGFIESLFPVVC